MNKVFSCLVLGALVLGDLPSYVRLVSPGADDPLEEQYGTLQHATVIFRHGDRSPYAEYPLDPHKDYPWPQGIGQLTNVGKKRMFDLGKWFKKRYRNLVGESYNRDRFLIQSSDLDRAIMSGLLFSYGFYPVEDKSEVWKVNETWHPIPIHTLPAEYDNILYYTKKCPEMDRLAEAAYDAPQYQKLYKKYKSTIDFIAVQTGWNFSNKTWMLIMWDLESLRDIFFVQLENNLTLPEWSKQVYPEPLNTLMLKTVYVEYYGKAAHRLILGPLLNSVMSDIIEKTTNVDFKQTLHVYSAHDATIFSLLDGLNVYSGLELFEPPYGAAVMIELWKKDNNNFITITYTSRTYKSPLLLSIPGCGQNCSVEQFLKLVKPLMPENWEEECQLPSSSSTSIRFSYLTLVPLVYIFV